MFINWEKQNRKERNAQAGINELDNEGEFIYTFEKKNAKSDNSEKTFLNNS